MFVLIFEKVHHHSHHLFFRLFLLLLGPRLLDCTARQRGKARGVFAFGQRFSVLSLRSSLSVFCDVLCVVLLAAMTNMSRSLVDVPVPRTVVELRLGPSAFPFLGVIDVPSNISRLVLSTGDLLM